MFTSTSELTDRQVASVFRKEMVFENVVVIGALKHIGELRKQGSRVYVYCDTARGWATLLNSDG